jgi:hypothetical protein
MIDSQVLVLNDKTRHLGEMRWRVFCCLGGDQKIAAFGSSYRSGVPRDVGAAEGCDLLI